MQRIERQDFVSPDEYVRPVKAEQPESQREWQQLESPPTRDTQPDPSWPVNNSGQESYDFQSEYDLEQKEREIIEKLEREEYERLREDDERRQRELAQHRQQQVSVSNDVVQWEDALHREEPPDIDESYDLTSSTVDDSFRQLAFAPNLLEKKVSQQVESVLQSQPPQATKSPVRRKSGFDPDEERRRMEEWTMEQERSIQVVGVTKGTMTFDPPAWCVTFLCAWSLSVTCLTYKHKVGALNITT